jgi:hypothetical protein
MKMKSKDEKIAKAEENAKRQAKKSCKPKDSRYVDGWEKYSEAGKGDKIRISDWHSEEMTEKLENIFGKKKTTD